MVSYMSLKVTTTECQGDIRGVVEQASSSIRRASTVAPLRLLPSKGLCLIISLLPSLTQGTLSGERDEGGNQDEEQHHVKQAFKAQKTRKISAARAAFNKSNQ
eukprot:GHVU01109729.1.p1 GENE.GHVU01109729.1~~GHVU01109729.1.p1  ORF type:complete len:103 (+),score=7.81 GHVU01109729.1:358-666(+)